MNTKSKDVVNNISQALKPKLLFPFRKGKNLDKIENIIHDEIVVMVNKHDKMYDTLAKGKEISDIKLKDTRERLRISNSANSCMRSESEQMKITHIRKPSDNFGVRLRFLFTGELN